MELNEITDSYTDNDLYRNHLLEQYKVYASRINGELSRSETINGFFLTISTALLTAPLLFLKLGAEVEHWNLVVGTLSIFVSIIWWLTLLSISKWQTAMFETIQSIETRLPVAPFTEEWRVNLREGKSYLKIRSIKLSVPIVFTILHISMLVLNIMK